MPVVAPAGDKVGTGGGRLPERLLAEYRASEERSPVGMVAP